MGIQPTPGEVREPEADAGLDTVDFRETQSSEKFQRLRRTHRSFVFPMAVIFIVWYFVYVLLAAFAPEFMAISVAGNVNVGIVLGLLQFVSTFGITAAYVSFANRRLDPQAAAIRADLEGDAE
ncbi:DUF485 domain-containing protein [Zhihengliuella halotolerans]|uniref:Uncharacterized membrane protein (DUF485 family) n=1 Tax=Zhihengliuella halotolerans TaxID=370736 RepID=A0A4Q8AE36_9MICC|nr:DUF485 domain-containing protein [Zhihengliuella halotolerans]RZU61945.1 uncharacterized membrane protein (DUF485 family) [Zhihengliuella halotolerans]